MSQNLRHYIVAIFGLEAAIKNVPASAWANPTPCDGWDARELAGHAMGVVNNIAARSGLGDLCDPFNDPGKIAGTDPHAAFVEIRNRVLEALDQPGALQREVVSATGTMPMDSYIATMVGDALIHTWDIARSTGTDERLDATLVALVHGNLLKRDPALLRAPGRFSPEVDCPEDADAQTRLLCFAGRQV